NVLRLAESLGAETVTLDGPSAAAALLEYAQTRRVTRVLVGAPKRHGWRAWARASTSTVLVKQARGFDVIVVAPAGRTKRQAPSAYLPIGAFQADIPWERYGWAAGVSGLCTLLAFAMYPHFDLSNLAMVYLLGVTVAGLRLGRGPSALTAVLNVLLFCFSFVPPRFTFAVADFQYFITFAAMLIIGLVISTLTANVRQQTRVAGARERRTAALYAMSRELAVTRGTESMAGVAVRHVAEVFDCRAVVLLPDAAGKLHRPRGQPS
ncbi:sensor histidine kinase KdpD, partial [mine drainage metagenome]